MIGVPQPELGHIEINRLSREGLTSIRISEKLLYAMRERLVRAATLIIVSEALTSIIGVLTVGDYRLLLTI